jgi:drug/metabolite transporter (DMT)-like permease
MRGGFPSFFAYENRNFKTNKIILPHSLAALACLLWGSAFPSVKTGYALFGIAENDSASQILFAGLRFTLAGLFVIVFACISERRAVIPKGKREWGHTLIISLFQTVLQYICFFIGLAHTSGVKSSILVSLGVFFSLIISALIVKMERFTWAKLLGTVAGFAGVLIVNIGGGGLAGFTLLGEGMIILSSLCSAVSSVLVKRFSESESPVMLSGWQFFAGGIAMSAFAFAIGGRVSFNVSAKAVLLLIYLGILSAAAYTIWSLLLKYNPVSRVAVFGFLNPVFGVLLSALFLGEFAQAFAIKNLPRCFSFHSAFSL